MLEWVQYKTEHPEDECDLVVDSGAYSAWSRGKEFDVDEYINFLNRFNEDERYIFIPYLSSVSKVIV